MSVCTAQALDKRLYTYVLYERMYITYALDELHSLAFKSGQKGASIPGLHPVSLLNCPELPSVHVALLYVWFEPRCATYLVNCSGLRLA